MPIYEFFCFKCKQIREIITTRVGQEVANKCPVCGSAKLKKLISKVKVKLSEETRLEKITDPSFLGNFSEDDPKSMAKMLKKIGPELGEDFDPGEIDEMVEESLSSQDSKENGTQVAEEK